jgi:hypothetical protein
MAKAAQTGRIFIDYLRNGRDTTDVAAYSTWLGPARRSQRSVKIVSGDQTGPRPHRQYRSAACKLEA